MSDSSATVIIIFVIFLLLAGGGTAAWYFLYYKPRQGPAPAPAYISPPTPIIITTPPPASAPSPEEDGDGDGGESDYDPLELGEVVSPAGSPSATFSLALWRSKMKKKFSKNRTVLQKRLEVLEAAVEDGKEMSGSVPSEHFDDAIKYIKDLIKKLPRKAPAPKAKTKKPPPTKKFNLTAWKVKVKNDLKGKKAAVITARIDRLKDAQTEKLKVRDGVPRAQYGAAIAWLRVLETEAKKPTTSKKFNLAAWKTATQKKLKNKSRVEIQRVITRFENSTAAVHDGVPKARKAQAVAFLKGLKAKAR